MLRPILVGVRRIGCVLALSLMLPAKAWAGDVSFHDVSSHEKKLIAVGVDEDDPKRAVVVVGAPFTLRARTFDQLGRWPIVAAGSGGFVVAGANTSKALRTKDDGATWSELPPLPSGVHAVAAWQGEFIALRNKGCELFILRPTNWEAVGAPPPHRDDCGALLTDGQRAVLTGYGTAFESADLRTWTRLSRGFTQVVGIGPGGGGVFASFRDDECSPSPAAAHWSHDGGATWVNATLGERGNYARSGACQRGRCVVATDHGYCFENGSSATCRKSGVRQVARLDTGFVGAGEGLFISVDGRSFAPLFVPRASN